MNNSVPLRFPAIFLAVFLGAASLAAAATITVNSTADVAANDGQCTLREAITAANTNVGSGAAAGECAPGSAGADTINFNIGSGTPTITLTSGLPAISQTVTINGNTGGATRVEIDGSNTTNATGLFFDNAGTSGSAVRYLVINRFDFDGIHLNNSDNNTIEGNFIGTDANGTAAGGYGVGRAGIFVASSQNNTIGGTAGTTPGGSCTGACNLISGNSGYAINLEQNAADGANSNIIQGNFIGTDVTGTIGCANGTGIRTFNTANNNQIGGTTAAARNVISGNGTGIGIQGGGTSGTSIRGNFIGTNSAGDAVLGNGYGVRFVTPTQNITLGGTAAGAGNVIAGNSRSGVYGRVDNGTIQGNFIGTDLTGTRDLGNGYFNGQGSGLEGLGGIVLLAGSTGNTIGGTATGAPNVVAFNRGAGVRLGGDNFNGSSGTSNPIRANAIYLNNGLGISLSDGGGVNGTPLNNDVGDPDTGANNRQNYPVLSSVSEAGGTITVTGMLNSLASTTFTIDFYASENQDASGKGEGETYIGSQTVTTDGNGDAPISFNYAVLPGQPFTTATATNIATNDTSEFSNAILLTANPGTFVFSSANYQVVEGAGVITITVNRANGSTGAACVDYSTGDATADSSDYTTAAGTLCFANGETSKTFNVSITDDATPESAETVNLILSSPTNGSAVGYHSVATLTIINDDSFVTYVVNNAADTDDGACTAAGTGNGCTLREAINAANATGDQDSITFDIGSTPTITATNALPSIDAPVIIDGNTGGATRVEINGNNISASGLTINSAASRTIIRRLVINRFNGSGINLTSSSDNIIEGNYIGTDSTGTIDLGNTGSGITFNAGNNNLIGGTAGTTPATGCSGSCNLISGNNGAGINVDPQGGSANGNTIQGNFIGTDVTGMVNLGNTGRGIAFLNAVHNTQIGGTSPAARNIISGNGDLGIFLSSAGIHGTQIQGNYIGVNRDATAKMGNSVGISIFTTATGNTVGGTAPGAANVIGGNVKRGIEITTFGASVNPPFLNVVQGNFIGTDPTGTVDLGNGQSGITVEPVGGIIIAQGAFNNTIGGANAGNVIAFNYGAGIRLGGQQGMAAAGAGNSLLNNTIYSNNGLGIALGDGSGILATPLANDTSDPDTGANNRQNYPVLDIPTSSGGTVAVTGFVNSVASTAFTIQFFVSPSGDATSTNGEGSTFVGSQTVTTNPSGNATITFSYPPVIGKQFLTATATNNATGDTSEFAAYVMDPTPQSNPSVVTANDASGNPNQPITVTATFTDPDGTAPYSATIECGNHTYSTDITVTAPGANPGTVSGTCTYDAPGTYVTTVTVTDSAGVPGWANSNVTVNAAPVADDGGLTTDEDAPANGNLRATDSDNPSLTYSIVTNPTKGVLSNFDSATGSFTYTPNANENGADSFTFKVNDGQIDSNVATESFTINPVNDAPTANPQSVTTDEDTAKPITLTGSDIEASALTFSVVTGPSHGALTGTPPNLTYTPAANYNGPDSFTFKANDGQADSSNATVSIIVTAVNDAPIATAQSLGTNEDTAKSITLTGTDTEGNALTFSVVAGPAHGALSGTAPNLTYTPSANYNGTDSFTFKANDSQADSNTATISITVFVVNDVPSFAKGPDQTVSQNSGPQTAANWASNISAGPADESGQGLTFMLTNNNTGLFSSQPAVSSNGTLTYAPASGASGSATVTVILRDSGGTADGGQDTSAPQIFTITVTAPTPSPTPTATATPTATPNATPTATPTTSPTATPSPTPSSTPAQALNISTRLRVDAEDKVMIAGFIITGNASKPVIIRGMGPSLAAANVPADQVLQDPVIELRGPNGALILQNDNWKDSPQRAQMEATTFAPADDREAVIMATLQPGAYTAIISGKNGTNGIGLIEVYDNNPSVDSTLGNLSTRGFVMIQEDVMIGGFVLGSNPASTRIVIRGLGPSLASSGLTNLLADPTLELHDGNGALLVSNDNWQDDPISAAQLTANGLAPLDPNEAAIFTTLPPGSFTAILAGQPPGTGVGLVEIYNLKQ
jgi:CSLREA domain-containing protein